YFSLKIQILKCEILRQKLDNLVSTLKQESLEAKRYSSSDEDRQKIFRRTDVVGDSKEFVENSSRMGSIKKAPRK
uniref:Uncharacterized protein n=1 Tax=Romanomermis culicivorax TaxID=13658 RepID=A0A915KST5_ROMCU